MEKIQSLYHTKWECKYHIVWIPKYRRKVLYGQLLKYLGELLHNLAEQKESKILEIKSLQIRPLLKCCPGQQWRVVLMFAAKIGELL